MGAEERSRACYGCHRVLRPEDFSMFDACDVEPKITYEIIHSRPCNDCFPEWLACRIAGDQTTHIVLGPNLDYAEEMLSDKCGQAIRLKLPMWGGVGVKMA